MKIKIVKIKAENGSIKHKIMMTGIAPKNGPNTGITFVTPIIRAIILVYGSFNIRAPK